MDQRPSRPSRRPRDGAFPVRDPMEALAQPKLVGQRTAGAAMLAGLLVVVIAVMSTVEAIRDRRFPWPELLAIAVLIGVATAGWITWRRGSWRR